MTAIRTKRLSDGTFIEVLSDGTTRPSGGKTDWARLDVMVDEVVVATALDDPDAQPLSQDDLKRMKRMSRAKTLRRALGLTQEEFAARYHIPIGTLRDWEQGRCEPDQPARAYLTVIASDPNGVCRMLQAKSGVRREG
jgi:putative transcriptional regulator